MTRLHTATAPVAVPQPLYDWIVSRLVNTTHTVTQADHDADRHRTTPVGQLALVSARQMSPSGYLLVAGVLVKAQD